MQRTWVETITDKETQLGVSVIARMARIFLDGTKDQLQTIKAALDRKNFATAREAAHNFAAHAEALCFEQLHKVALACEEACAAHDGAKAAALQKDLTMLLDICALQVRTRYKLS